MERSFTDYESEVVSQILIAEACFDICSDIPVVPGLGSHMFSFLHNLAISKGILSLHSLLKPAGKEISLKGYIALAAAHGRSKGEVTAFKKEISGIQKRFEEVAPWMLRHKAVAHLDPGFKHADFTCAYLASDYLDRFRIVTSNLKTSVFRFANYDRNQYPMENARQQVRDAISALQDAEGRGTAGRHKL